MAFLFYMFSCQLVLVTIYCSDKHLKDVPKIYQGIDRGNENETDTDDAQVVSNEISENALQETLQEQSLDSIITQRQNDTDLSETVAETNAVDTSVEDTVPQSSQTVSVKPLPETTDADYCTSNPCRNGGTCIPDEGGYTYTCKCAYKWYTGKDCEKDDGPCRDNDCYTEGIHSCGYNGPDEHQTICNCKVGYDGDKCETVHPYSKYPLVRNVVDSCNERGLSQNECIADTFGIDVTGKTEDEVLEELREKDVIDVFVSFFSKVFNTPVFTFLNEAMPLIFSLVTIYVILKI